MSSPLPQEQVDQLLSQRRENWKITSKQDWADWVKRSNWDLSLKSREMIECRAWYWRSLSDYLDIPEWLIKCLVGVPPEVWWMEKVEMDCPSGVILP